MNLLRVQPLPGGGSTNVLFARRRCVSSIYLDNSHYKFLFVIRSNSAVRANATMSSSVFVGNLTWTTNDEQLKEFANSVGPVVSAEVKRHEDTSRSKGWGLVTFVDHGTAARCVAELNGREFNGRQVHVRLDRDVIDSTHNVFVGNLPWGIKDPQLQHLFQPFRPVECQVATNQYGKSRGFGIVKFASEADAHQAIAQMHMLDVGGRNLECRLDRGPGKNDEVGVRTAVFVGKLGMHVTDDVLAAMFAHLGVILSAKVHRFADKKSDGWGIVKFADPNAARAAVDTMNGALCGPGHPGLKVRFDRK